MASHHNHITITSHHISSHLITSHHISSHLNHISSHLITSHHTAVGFPLTIFGGIFGKNIASNFDAPCRTKNIAREIPSVPWYARPHHPVLGHAVVVCVMTMHVCRQRLRGLGSCLLEQLGQLSGQNVWIPLNWLVYFTNHSRMHCVVHMCIYVCMYAYVHIRTYVCICAYTYVCMYMCMRMYIFFSTVALCRQT